MCVIVLGFGATHKAVAKMEVVNRMLCKQVPTKVLLIAHALLGGVWTCMTHMPHMSMEPAFIHGLANTAITLFVHAWHHITIELANAMELFARHREAAEGCAGLLVKVLRRRVESLLSCRLEGQWRLRLIEWIILMRCPGYCKECGPARPEYAKA